MAETAILQLVQRIENALKSDIGGHEAAKLAWAYADAVARVNEELVECADLFSEEQSMLAFAKLRSRPLLLERMKALKFSSLKGWEECCAFFGWRKAEALKDSLAAFLVESFEELKDPKQLLIEEFRAKRGMSDPLAGIKVLKLLCSEFPAERDYKIELKRLTEMCLEKLDQELELIGDFSKNRSKVAGIVDRYLEGGIKLRESTELFREAELSKRTHEANVYVQEFLDEAESHNMGDDWHAFERAFFRCECHLDRIEALDLIDPDYKRTLGDMSSRLYSLRGGYEVNLQVRNTLAMSAGKARQKKLERLVAHANVMGYEIDAELRSEVSVVGKKDKGQGAPKYIALLGVAVPLFIVGAWILHGVNQEPPVKALVKSDVAEVEQQEPADLAKSQKSLFPVLEEAAAGKTEDRILDAEKALQKDLEAKTAVVVEQKAVDPAYLHLLEDMKHLVDAEYSLELDEEEARILKEARTFANVDQENYKDVAIEFAMLVSQFEAKKERRISELTTTADFAIVTARRLGEGLESVSSEAGMRIGILDTEKAIDDAYRAINAAKGVKADYSFSGLEEAEAYLKNAQQSFGFLKALRLELAECKSLESYYSLLGGLLEFDFIAQSETDRIEAILKNRFDAKEALKELVLPDRPDEWDLFVEKGDYIGSPVMPSPEELTALLEFSNEPFYSSVYVSKFRYYQGGLEPEGEREVYLSEPIVKIGTEKEKTANITFKEYGFDDEGNPHLKPRNLNFIRREGGETFGFYYEPSVLSPESDYFVNHVQGALEDSMSGAPRLQLMEMVQSIASEKTVPPTLKASWILGLFEIIEMDRFKWGAEFSPAFDRLSSMAKQLAAEGVSKNAWLVMDERRSPSPSWSNYFEVLANANVFGEMLAFADYMEQLVNGSFNQVGFVDQSGGIRFTVDVAADERLWRFDAESNSFDRVKEGVPLLPYSIVFAFGSEGGNAVELLGKVSEKHGVDLTHVRFESSLPPLVVQ